MNACCRTARGSGCSAPRTGAAGHTLKAGRLLLPPLEMPSGALCLPLGSPSFLGGWRGQAA